MIKINGEVLKQLDKKGLLISESIYIDSRLVHSTSRPIRSDEIKKLREKKETPEVRVDKNDNRLKFSCDSESDWITLYTKNEIERNKKLSKKPYIFE